MEHNKIVLTAVIIAKNEAARIEKCLLNIAFADEIILVDNGSTDATPKLAQKYHAKVIRYISSDFSALRNIGKEAAKGEWILYVDADETVTGELKTEIRQIISAKQRAAAYNITRINYYLGTKWPTKDQMQRLFQKRYLRSWHGELHETAHVDGNTGTLTYSFIHDTHRTLSEMTDKTNQWSQTEALLRYEAHHPSVVWWRFPRVMIPAFWQSYVREKGYEAGIAGLIEAIYQSFSIFITYAKLWELQRNDAGS